MKNYLVLLIILIIGSSVQAQDFKFRGKAVSTITQDYDRGNDVPTNEEASKKKVDVSFDGATLLIGKDSYKYMWHQNSRVSDVIQVNCIERVEDTAPFPYIDAKFELVFLPDDVINITQYRETSPTTYSKIQYSVNVIKTTN